MNNIKGKGIRDLMDQGRFTTNHVRKALMDAKVPGNWDSLQNIYNLIDGKSIPRDSYVYIVLADLMGVDVRTILLRYTRVVMTEKTEGKELLFDGEINW